MMVDPHVAKVMGFNITDDEIYDEVNMEVEPPISSFDLTKLPANKMKKNYLRSKNVLDDELIEDFIATNKSIYTLARIANMPD